MEPTLASKSENILFVQTAFLGDVLLSIPTLKKLRERGSVTLLCRRGVGSFFKDAGLVDHVIEVDKSSRASWAFARKALAGAYDLVLCPHESFRTALFVARVHSRVKIGFSRWFNFAIFNHRVRRPLELPEALRQLALLEPLDSSVAGVLEKYRRQQAGVEVSTHFDTEFDRLLPVPAGFDMRVFAAREGSAETAPREVISPVVQPFARAAEPVVVMAPGSVWKTKMWTKAGFVETGRALASAGAIVAITGSKDEAKLCQEIAALIPNSVSLAGRLSLYESAQLMSFAKLLVCNDSGAMHLGATAGVPIVSVFGPTVLRFGYRPWSSLARVVQTDLVCRPCGKHGSNECPLGHHNCMKMVSSASVLKAAREVVDPSVLSKL